MDVALQRQIETVHFMQVVPWLGVVPNKEGQLQQLLADDNFSPLVSIFKQATDEVIANPNCSNPNAFISMAKQAQVAGNMFHNFLLNVIGRDPSCHTMSNFSQLKLE